jgi:hypothetical protein
VPSPRVEVGSIWLDILRLWESMTVEDELVGAEEESTVAALDAFRPTAVVSTGIESSSASPCTLMVNFKGE